MSENHKFTENLGSVLKKFVHPIKNLMRHETETGESKKQHKRFLFKLKKGNDASHTATQNELKATVEIKRLADAKQVTVLTVGEKSRKTRDPLFIPRTKRPNFVLGVILTTFKLGIAAIFIIMAVGGGILMGVANAFLGSTPDLNVEKIQNKPLSSYIYDQQGTLLATYTGKENRDWATLNQIPVDLQHAVIAKEDIRFYSHIGVDIKRLFGAMVSNLSSNAVQGGSTITQQVIKNSILTNERTYKRKLQEAYLAVELEQKYTKDQILDAYLNTIPLGGTIYGVKTAAREYFGKDLSELSLKQEVCLAAVIESPYTYDPHRVTYASGNSAREVGALQNKMNEVTERMYAAGFITKQQFDDTFVPKSVWSSPDFLDQWKSTMGILETPPSLELYPYPHFIEYTVDNVETMFLRKENLEDTPQNRAVIDNQIRQNGYKIYCTIDEEIQDTVQNTISGWNRYPSFRNRADSLVTNSDGTTTIEPQVSAVVIDNSTGDIVAMIGSREPPTVAKSLNRAADAHMPVGSSIKPLAVYGPAFDKGLSPATPIANVPVPIPGWHSKEGYPTTSQGTYGPVPIRKGIINSWNIVAARTLMEDVGIEDSAGYLQKLDVNMNYVKDTGDGLALGQSGLTTLEMAGGYACIANNGYYREPVAFTKVVDKNGNVVLNADDYRKEYQVYKPSTAWMLVDVLTDAVNKGTGHNARIPGITVAGKTGTVVDNKGVFFAGMTGYYTSTLWVGSDKYKPFVSGIAASNSSAPLWQAYMSQIFKEKGLGNKPIIDKTPQQEGLVRGTVDAVTGGAPAGNGTVTDWFAAGTVPANRIKVPQALQMYIQKSAQATASPGAAPSQAAAPPTATQNPAPAPPPAKTATPQTPKPQDMSQ